MLKCAGSLCLQHSLRQSYDYFSASVPFSQIPHSRRDLTQRVTPVDNRSYFSGFYELAHRGQVLLAPSRLNHDHLPAREQ